LTQRSLLDLNVLIALTDQRHSHHTQARDWFASSGRNGWGICPLTEAGFLRVTTNPTFRPDPQSLQHAIAILQSLKSVAGYWYCEIKETDTWVKVTTPFAVRISGHQQITDAYLLGLAIKNKAALVSFDKGIRHMAGTEFKQNVILLE